MKVLIVGGVASGMSAAARLRRLDESAEITVFEASSHVSYANCGLPYFVGEVIEKRSSLLLQTPESLWDRFRIRVLVKHRVTEIDRGNNAVTVTDLESGESITETYDNLILATGATPRVPKIPGIGRATWLRNVTDADSVKEALTDKGGLGSVILGGGFVGIELAENIRQRGLPVTIVQRGNSLLGQFDPEMVKPLQDRLIANGVEIRLNAEAASIDETTVTLTDGSVIQAGLVFAATGVEPDNALAKSAGLEIGKTGGLLVDEKQRTSDPKIFAAGDAVEKHGELTGEQTLIPLANLANRHGRLIADVISGQDVRAHASLGTIIIGTFGLQTAMTGLSERTAQKSGISHQIIHVHPNSHAGYYPGAVPVSLKVLFDPANGKILGAQGYGEDGVDKRIDVLSVAIRSGMTIDELMDLELSYAPQFGSAKDAVNIAGYVGNNVYRGMTPTVQWYEVDEKLAAGAQLVDVRTPSEHAAGHIPNSLNIPVDELRDRLPEVQLEDVVVYCAVGQRGHVATQILKAHGAKVSNLDGGYRTWSVATSK